MWFTQSMGYVHQTVTSCNIYPKLQVTAPTTFVAKLLIDEVTKSVCSITHGLMRHTEEKYAYKENGNPL